jgi:site-specific recombinase XerD
MTNESISALRRRMMEDMTVRNLSPTTRASYIHNVKKFSQYFGRSPDRLGLEDVRAYQVHLVSRGVAWATLNQVVSSLRFFFGVTLGRKELPERIAYARRPKTLPVILSPEEVAAFLEAVESRRDRVALTTAYATGLRASEVVELCTHDIDSSRMVIHVANGKGGKQRYVMLSPKLLGILRAYWDIERPRRPWLFPGRGGEKPLDPSTLNAACAAAIEATGISKQATLHSLRHAFATHLVEQGVDISIVQALLGHSHLSTTIRYISVATRTIAAVKSPLEHLRLTVPEMRPQLELRPSG